MEKNVIKIKLREALDELFGVNENVDINNLYDIKVRFNDGKTKDTIYKNVKFVNPKTSRVFDDENGQRVVLPNSTEVYFSKKSESNSLSEAGHKDFERNPRRDDDEPKKNNLNKKQGEGGKKDYTDVKRSFEKIGGPSMVDVMKLTGIPDDEKGVNRSLFRKKVKQIKNKDTGSYYQFSDEELNQVRAALDIQK